MAIKVLLSLPQEFLEDIDRVASEEHRSLGKVLQRIMLGDTQVDLSGLTEEMREVIQKMKDEG